VVRSLCIGALVAAAVVSGRGQQQTTGDWTWRTDVPATLGSGDAVGPAAWHFVTMAPGWHITTGPGALLYPAAANSARGNFRIEAEIFLFPGDAPQEYGIFIGGSGLDRSSTTPAYTAFVVRRDGRAAILRGGSAGSMPVRDWAAADGVVPHPGGTEGTAKNRLSVDVGPREIAFGANGKPIATIPRADLQPDGIFGLRIGANLNLHVSAFDVTYRLAPR
jgi:hypothetical protein